MNVETANPRIADYPVSPLFLDRWSPRSLTGEHIELYTLLTLLEAARWAPSSSNSQPWRFIYALRDSIHWPRLLHLLAPSNQLWARNASALVLVLAAQQSRSQQSGQLHPLPMSSFDTGIAAGYIALEAELKGLAVHIMAGFDRERTVADLHIPALYAPQVMLAVGKRAPAELLPDALQAREVPSSRIPLSEIAFEGQLPEE